MGVILEQGRLTTLKNKADNTLAHWELRYSGNGYYEGTIIVDFNRYSGFGHDRAEALGAALDNYGNYYGGKKIR